MTKNKCPECGYENIENSNFCRNCGINLNAFIKEDTIEKDNANKEIRHDLKIKEFIKKNKRLIIFITILIVITAIGGVIYSSNGDNRINLDKEYVNIMRKKLNGVGIVNKNEQNIIIACIEGVVYYSNRLGEYITIEDAIDEIFEYPEVCYETLDEFKEEGIEDVEDVKEFLKEQFMEKYKEQYKSGLIDPTDLGAMLLENDTEEQTMSTQDYFYNLRIQKAQSDSKIKEEMKAITEDASASQEAKDIANNSLIQKAQLQEQESRVEMGIMNKGYEDAICMIDSNKVTVYVKVKGAPTKEESSILQQLVEDITGLSDIQIETKK